MSQESPPEASPEASPDTRATPTRRRLAEALRHSLERSDPGTLAALRRMRPMAPPPAFFRVATQILDDGAPEGGPRREATETGWACVAQAMAMAITPGARSLLARVPLGEACAAADVSEMRLLGLLNAEGEPRFDRVRGVVQQLIAKGKHFDAGDLAELLLSQGDAEESARRHIARGYYRRLDKPSSP